MKREAYQALRAYMEECMKDAAHDRLHVYRVLYLALEIAQGEAVDQDILIAAALLHDIGRAKQNEDPAVNHALAESLMARERLLGMGWSQSRADWVADCIRTHRFRSDDPPVSLEARVLFDADKLEVAGALGAARTLLYEGYHGIPLYREEGEGEDYFTEYRRKLSRVCDGLLTRRGRELGLLRRKALDAYTQALAEEIRFAYQAGRPLLEDALT